MKRINLKLSACLISLFFLFSCTTKEDINELTISTIESSLSRVPSQGPFEGNYLFFKDVSYGSKSRNKLDVLLPREGPIKGTVLFFHGGAFLFGTKEDLYEGELQAIIASVLEENIAVINAEYTFIDDMEAAGVITSLEDGSAVIEFLSSRAANLNLPSNKFVLAGVSAGAGIAQWNGFRPEHNTQIKGVFASIAQSSYDLYQWEQIFPDFSVDALRATSPELEDLFLKFYNGTPTEEIANLLDYRSQMDATDPPLYIYNPVYEDRVVNPDSSIDFNVLFHSYKHADFLRKKAVDVGLEYSGIYQEAPLDFILRVLLRD